MMTQTLSTFTNQSKAAAQTGSKGVFARLAGAVAWLVELPRRQAVLAELSELSDHELADIGLVRSDLGRVFDADFASQRARHHAARASMV
jgi:uncharacterized protein YjiS (DUF1127 family)